MTSTDSGWSAADLRAAVAAAVEEDPADLAAQDNLFELGLDSMALIRLVAAWRASGTEVAFAELAEDPTLAAWNRLRVERAGALTAATAQGPTGDQRSDGPFPLARLQHAYWIGRAPSQPLGGVAAHLYTEFDRPPGAEPLRPARLRAALDALVARHEMLRARFTDNGEQEVMAAAGWRGLRVHDLTGFDAAGVEARLAEVRDALSHQLLDVERGEVFSVALSLLPGGATRLHVDVDMLAGDAVSYRILLADLARLCANPDRLPEPVGYRFRDYLADLGRRRADRVAADARWWAERLADLPGAPDLPLAPERPGARARSVRRHVVLSAADRAALSAAARRHGLTPAMALATAFAEVVGAWSSEPRFLLNVPTFDREPLHPAVADLVGDFTSSVLLDVDLTEPLGFAERARRLQARMHSAAGHVHYSGVEVLRDLARARGQQMIAPVVFTSALSLGELYDDTVRETLGEPVWTLSQGPQVLLDAQVTEFGGGLLVNWDLRADRFADGVVDAMFAAYRRLVEALVAGSEAAWTGPVPDLRPPAQAAVRARVNATAAPRSGRLLHQGFFARAADTPGAPALLWGRDGVLSYGELAERALRVAGALHAAGTAPGDAVGIRLPKGPDQVVAVLGVLAAGGCYVPIGVEQPPARAGRIVDTAGVGLVLGHADGAPAGVRVVGPAETLAAAPLAAPMPGDEEDRAYLLFTSGSTGEPKGVEVPHRAAMATLDDLVERFGIGAADRTLAVSALDFDLSVFDIFAPLGEGGAVVVVGADERTDATRWAALVRERGVTVLNCVPALLDMLLSCGEPLGDELRAVLLGGDRVGVDLPGRLRAVRPGCRFAGLGGTTETAIHSTVCEVPDGGPVPADWRSVPYGTPLHNVALRVVDRHGRDAPDWVPGELWIGGEGVALGYRGDPERTADRFPGHDGRRWYRTGDLARYRPDGCVEFLGRRDNQVKVRGFRIELGEIEAALTADDRVGDAVAAVVGGRLVAAATPAGPAPDPDGLRAALRDRVPPHMVPDRVVLLEAMPLSGNGKVDRAAVTARLTSAAPPAGTSAPLTDPVQRVVALVWSEVLAEAGAPVDGIGADDEFVALGGDSVLATAVVARLREALDSAAPSVRLLFAAPGVAGLAAALHARDAADGEPGRTALAAEIYLEVAGMSDDEVGAALGAADGTGADG
ncbi:non-ribosomal peptide synthetase [Pseudonocardia lacus]|uniref:non-ribosomal peptide synthetase n=1 Tax=Pseudonocardia lacus TaxID=2835865 RepID=UPI001BDBFC18|nr:non-ribosomal peptide synthetase [Pseudonocardia lacus]